MPKKELDLKAKKKALEKKQKDPQLSASAKKAGLAKPSSKAKSSTRAKASASAKAIANASARGRTKENASTNAKASASTKAKPLAKASTSATVKASTNAKANAKTSAKKAAKPEAKERKQSAKKTASTATKASTKKAPGTEAKRSSKPSSVSFEAKFYSDLELKDMIHAKIIRCMETGRITKISYPDLTEGYFWITAHDIPGQHFIGNTLGRVPILCEGEILYPGEPVGILAGPDEAVLEELAGQFKIECSKETLEASLKLNSDEEEKEEDTPLAILQELGITGISKEKKPSEQNEEDSLREIFSDILAERKVQSGPCFKKEGGIEEVFANCAHVIEHEWSYKINIPDFNEPNGAICDYNGKTLTVYTPTQWISNLRQTLSAALSLNTEDIIIKKTKSFNQGSSSIWYNSIVASQVAVASYMCGKPVKLVYTREEQELYMDTMRPVTIRHKTGVSESGRIAAMKINIDFDAGAHNPFAQEIMDRLVIASCGCYNPQNVSITARANSSASQPSSIDLRLVDSAAFFAVENQMNLLCEECRISPVEIRMLNFLDKDTKKTAMPFSFKLKKYFEKKDLQVSGTDVIMKKEKEDFVRAVSQKVEYSIPSYYMIFDESGKNFLEFERKYEAYRQQVLYRRQKNRTSLIHSKDSPVRGIGFACSFAGTCYLGSQIYGGGDQSLEATYTEDKTVIIHCPPVSATIQEIWKRTVTEILQHDVSSVKINSSFSEDEEPLLPETVYSNISVMTQLLRKCCETIKTKLSRKKNEFPFTVQKSVTSSLKKLWNTNSFSGQPFHSTSFAAAILELELDPCTFREKIKKIQVFVDGGKILNPVAAQSSVRLGIQRILTSLVAREKLDYEIQDIEISFLESEEAPMQIGENVFHIIPAAYTQALSQALDHTVSSLPLSIESIFEAANENYLDEFKRALVQEVDAVSSLEQEQENSKKEKEE
ncbi:MAG: xanthine dehydrogenase family protein [Treponema sp.]|nr:xanthine dehydrogenase family protein [Treponema sp.]